MGNSICSAAFCESAALRESTAWRERAEPSPSRLAPCHLPRKGEVLLYLPEGAEKLPLRGSWTRPTGAD